MHTSLKRPKPVSLHRSSDIIKFGVSRRMKSHSFLTTAIANSQDPQPARSPNSLAQSSNSCRPCLLTLGRMLIKLASKSSNWMGRISSVDMDNSASPKLLSGPIAASFAKAVISLPEKPDFNVSMLNQRRKCGKGTFYHLSTLLILECRSWRYYAFDAPRVSSAALL